MIDLKRCNYITGQTSAVSFGISKIIDFFENSGKTPLFLYKKDSNFHHLIHTSRIEFTNKSEFDLILTNKSNLFRVDIVIVDLWFLNNVGQVISYKKELDKLQIDYIIITNKYHYIEGDPDVNIYKIETEFTDEHNRRFDTKYLINDIVSNSKTTMDDLVLAFRRDKKINDIFGGKTK
jgi:hypothetical protein